MYVYLFCRCFYSKKKVHKGESLPPASAGKPSSAAPSPKGDTPLKSPADAALSWEEQKRLDAERRKIEKEVARLEAKITELEEKKSELENKLADPAVYSNGEKAKAVQREINELAAQIDETTLAWEAAAEKLN